MFPTDMYFLVLLQNGSPRFDTAAHTASKATARPLLGQLLEEYRRLDRGGRARCDLPCFLGVEALRRRSYFDIIFTTNYRFRKSRSGRAAPPAAPPSLACAQSLICRENAAGGGGWIRTNVGVRQRIYSPSPLASRAPLRAERAEYCQPALLVNAGLGRSAGLRGPRRHTASGQRARRGLYPRR